MDEIKAASDFVRNRLIENSKDGPNQSPAGLIDYLLTIPERPKKICDVILSWLYRCAGEGRWNDIDEALKLVFENIIKLDDQSISAFYGYTMVMSKNLKNRKLLRAWNIEKMKEFYGPQWEPSKYEDGDNCCF